MADPSAGEFMLTRNAAGYLVDAHGVAYVINDRGMVFVADVTPREPEADEPVVVDSLTHVLDCGCTISRYVSRCPMHGQP